MTADRNAKPTVGFIGLGRMGQRMARNIARSGFELNVYNRTKAKTQEIAEAVGAHVRETPADVASSSDIVITMLADADAVDEVYRQRNGILDGIRPGTVAVDMGTTGPDAIRALARSVEAGGATLVDACVSGSVAFAESATLTVMVGGDAADVKRIEPVLHCMATHIFHVGAVGAGATLKLAVNAVIYGLCVALSEGLVFAERAGIRRAMAYDVFAASAVAAPFVHYRRAEFERPGDTPVAFRLELAKKDMDLILALAESVGAPMPQGHANRAVLAAAMAAGFADQDVAATAEFLRREAGGMPDGRMSTAREVRRATSDESVDARQPP